MISIIKYNAGNVKSAQNALQKLGDESVIIAEKEIILHILLDL